MEGTEPHASAFQWASRSAAESILGVVSSSMWASLVHAREERVTNRTEHWSLKTDLVEHIWDRHGG